jgi:phospholipid/cholesterol/gamma-HCH transport system substrate-binding protein
MARLPKRATQGIVALVVAAIVATGVYFIFFAGSSDKKVSAQFASAVGIYPGTPVRILGVNVGTVSGVHPEAGYVQVDMTYDGKYTLPSNVTAVEVANSLVSDRYIQLTPTWNGTGATRTAFPSGATIPLDRTGGPAELDDIYAALNKLAVSLGPQGANQGGQKNGALSALLNVAAANLKGNGAALGNSITKLSQAAKTLADNRTDLFGTVRNLQQFTATLQASDSQIRLFNQQLAQVASDLASERSDLGAALSDLAATLDKVNTFVKANAAKFHTDVRGLEAVTNVLVKEKASLNETLAVGPVALANLVHTYDPSIGVIETRGNLTTLTNPDLQKTATALVCGILNKLPGGVLSGLLKKLHLPGLGSVCPSSSSSTTVPSVTVPSLIGSGS